MYRYRLVAVVGIGCFVFIGLDFPYRLQFLPICVGLLLFAWWIGGK